MTCKDHAAVSSPRLISDYLSSSQTQNFLIQIKQEGSVSFNQKNVNNTADWPAAPVAFLSPDPASCSCAALNTPEQRRAWRGEPMPRFCVSESVIRKHLSSLWNEMPGHKNDIVSDTHELRVAVDS